MHELVEGPDLDGAELLELQTGAVLGFDPANDAWDFAAVRNSWEVDEETHVGSVVQGGLDLDQGSSTAEIDHFS